MWTSQGLWPQRMLIYKCIYYTTNLWINQMSKNEGLQNNGNSELKLWTWHSLILYSWLSSLLRMKKFCTTDLMISLHAQKRVGFGILHLTECSYANLLHLRMRPLCSKLSLIFWVTLIGILLSGKKWSFSDQAEMGFSLSCMYMLGPHSIHFGKWMPNCMLLADAWLCHLVIHDHGNAAKLVGHCNGMLSIKAKVKLWH